MYFISLTSNQIVSFIQGQFRRWLHTRHLRGYAIGAEVTPSSPRIDPHQFHSCDPKRRTDAVCSVAQELICQLHQLRDCCDGRFPSSRAGFHRANRTSLWFQRSGCRTAGPGSLTAFMMRSSQSPRDKPCLSSSVQAFFGSFSLPAPWPLFNTEAHTNQMGSRNAPPPRVRDRAEAKELDPCGRTRNVPCSARTFSRD